MATCNEQTDRHTLLSVPGCFASPISEQIFSAAGITAVHFSRICGTPVDSAPITIGVVPEVVTRVAQDVLSVPTGCCCCAPRPPCRAWNCAMSCTMRLLGHNVLPHAPGRPKGISVGQKIQMSCPINTYSLFFFFNIQTCTSRFRRSTALYGISAARSIQTARR